MTKPKTKKVDKKILFVHSLLRALGEKKLTKEQVHEKYIKIRPGNVFKKIFTPPADIHTVDVYLKTLTNHGYVGQEIAPWSENGTAQVILYFIENKGREFLNGKSKGKK